MTISIEIIGVPELAKVFDELKRSAANRVAGPALRKAASLAAKKVKASIPSRYKGVRAAIGWRSLKTRFNGGYVSVKVGGGVVKRTAGSVMREERINRQRANKKAKRKGVGISRRNVHWWFLGTKERQQKTGGQRRTGRMRAQASVGKILSQAANEINNVLRTSLAENLEKEAARLSRKS